MELLYKRYSPRITVDAYPSQLIFTRPDKNLRITLGTFLYMVFMEEYKIWRPISIGEEIVEEHLRVDPNIVRVEVFDSVEPIQFGAFDREDLMLMLLEEGLSKCLDQSRFHLKPVVHFLGADRFSDRFKKPREMFERLLKSGSAGTVVFDQVEL